MIAFFLQQLRERGGRSCCNYILTRIQLHGQNPDAWVYVGTGKTHEFLGSTSASIRALQEIPRSLTSRIPEIRTPQNDHVIVQIAGTESN